MEDKQLVMKLLKFLLFGLVIVGADNKRFRAAGTVQAWAEKLWLERGMEVSVDVVVAQDGTGNFTTIGAAIAAAPQKNIARHVIHVKGGVYNEIVRIPKTTWNVTLIGDGIGVTIITGNRSTDSYTMPETATVGVDGPGFMAQDLTTQNTAGAEKNQSVAFRCHSHLSIIYRCSFEGYQDTLLADKGFQFYRDCNIYGTIDFIFGDATAVFQNCLIIARLPRHGQANVVTAQARQVAGSSTGFVFQFCNITGDPLLRVKGVKTYLGRPWKIYSRVVFLECFIDDIVHPSGYVAWEGSSAGLDTLFYGEYNNTALGSHISGRVKWPGFHVIDAAEAGNFTVANFIEGRSWLPGKGVDFNLGL